MLFKTLKISYPEFGSHPVRRSRTIYAILEEGIMGNIHVKLFEIWASASGGDVDQRKSLQMTHDGWMDRC